MREQVQVPQHHLVSYHMKNILFQMSDIISYHTWATTRHAPMHGPLSVQLHIEI